MTLLTIRICLWERGRMRHISGMVQFFSKYFFKDITRQHG